MWRTGATMFAECREDAGDHRASVRLWHLCVIYASLYCRVPQSGAALIAYSVHIKTSKLSVLAHASLGFGKTCSSL